MDKKIEAKLTEWTNLNYQLRNARTQLQIDGQDRAAGKARKAEVERLERACAAVMKEVQAELSSVRRSDNPN